MKYVVNELLNNCLQRVNVCGNGQSVDGNTAAAALVDLNDAITELNLNEYLNFNYVTFDVAPKSDTITIGPEDSYDCKLEEAPLTVVSVSRKIGNRYLPLYKVDKTTLDRERSNSGVASCYAYETEYDTENDSLVSKILLNTKNPTDLRILLLRAMPQYRINDNITLPQAYVNLIEAALCVKTCDRYKLEYAQIYRDELDALKETIERINNSNRPLTLADALDGDYMQSYYNGLAGRGW